MIFVRTIEYFFDYGSFGGTHWFFQMMKEVKPVDFSVLVVGFLKDLDVVFFHEDSIGIEGLSKKEVTFSKMNTETNPVIWGSKCMKLL